MTRPSRMIRIEESIEESYDRNKVFVTLDDRVNKLTPKQLRVALRAIVAGKSVSKAITFAENHPKR